MSIITATEWEQFLEKHPDAHLLQSSGWGMLKSAFGWDASYILADDSGAQILFRRLPLGFTFGYIPKGPVGRDWELLWPEVDRLCRRKRAIFLKVEPDLWEPSVPSSLSDRERWLPSRPIQPPRTILIPLEGNQDQWLDRMKPKTRYNIRLAERKEVDIQVAQDVHAFHEMMLVTGSRDGFGVHSLAYVQRAYDCFKNTGDVLLLVAKYKDQPLAGLMAFSRGDRAWYFYGASTNEERNRMPTYLLQWEAMRWAESRGCRWYDLWGVPDASEEELEANFAERSDGLWGVYRFKRGFGGELKRAVGAWDRVYQPLLYRVIQQVLARRQGEGG
jgi:peptidoglycan pentaglycine glycine transferase (the first glycine)